MGRSSRIALLGAPIGLRLILHDIEAVPTCWRAVVSSATWRDEEGDGGIPSCTDMFDQSLGSDAVDIHRRETARMVCWNGRSLPDSTTRRYLPSQASRNISCKISSGTRSTVGTVDIELIVSQSTVENEVDKNLQDVKNVSRNPPALKTPDSSLRCLAQVWRPS